MKKKKWYLYFGLFEKHNRKKILGKYKIQEGNSSVSQE